MKKSLATVALLCLALAKVAIPADPPKDNKAPAQPEMKLPPGWTMDDMKACMEAGTPGKMHEWLAKSAGTWAGKTTMWMGPGGETQKSECTANFTSIMGNRYLSCEIKGDMPGMGPFLGQGTYGFDNVLGKFVSTWIDNQGTGIMFGTGELSKDGKTLTWQFTYNCPINKKPVSMREVDTVVDDKTRTLEMFGPDPKSGKEYQMMKIEFTKK